LPVPMRLLRDIHRPTRTAIRSVSDLCPILFGLGQRCPLALTQIVEPLSILTRWLDCEEDRDTWNPPTLLPSNRKELVLRESTSPPTRSRPSGPSISTGFSNTAHPSQDVRSRSLSVKANAKSFVCSHTIVVRFF
jgi:hypothetical protein